MKTSRLLLKQSKIGLLAIVFLGLFQTSTLAKVPEINQIKTSTIESSSDRTIARRRLFRDRRGRCFFINRNGGRVYVPRRRCRMQERRSRFSSDFNNNPFYL